MARLHFFNTTGPCNPAFHYMLPPEDRLVGAQLHRYIEDQLYWVLHAPRQTGKLISWSSDWGFKIANPVYEEILTRDLNSGYHDNLPPPSTWKWQKANGDLDMDSLLQEFQKFWRRHSEIWEQKSDYTEAFPHLLLMAFLQRILNGGERIGWEQAEDITIVSA